MGISPVDHALIFLIKTFGGLYIFAVLLRLLLQTAQADFYNPLSQFLVKITNPVLRPLRRWLPAIGPVDTAIIVLLIVLQMLVLQLSLWVIGGGFQPGRLFVAACAELLSLTVNVYIFAIIIQVILSWIQPGYHPLVTLLYQLNEPVLRPARRIIPPISGLDLSPLIAIIALQLFSILIVGPLTALGGTPGW